MASARKSWAILMVAATCALMLQPSPSAARFGSVTLVLKVVVPPRTPSLARILSATERELSGPVTLIVAGRPIELSMVPPTQELGHEVRRLVVRAN